MYPNNFHGLSGDAKAPPTELQPQYRISLTLAVTDERALWSAAAARLLGAPGLTLDDVVAVIGPCDDPSIGDCIAAVAKPDAVAGCVLDDFWIDGLGKAPPRLETAVVQGDERKARRLPARRTAVPALHLLVAGPANQNRLD